MHFRGCSGSINRLPRRYHAGETDDFDQVVAHVARRHPRSAVDAVGFSLGANVLLKWLGERPAQRRIRRAAGICTPLRLDAAARRMEQGLSRLYRRRLITLMRDRIERKFDSRASPVSLIDMRRARTFFEFDDVVTAPLHGFGSVHEYYREASAMASLPHVRTPTLLVFARDDPLLSEAVIPGPRDIGPALRVEIAEAGGHVGFVAGPWPWRPTFWLESRIQRWLDADDSMAGAADPGSETQRQGDGPLVHQRDLHVGAESPGAHIQSPIAQGVDEAVKQHPRQSGL
jgi:predicted alpha/beta-fold hydrolase